MTKLLAIAVLFFASATALAAPSDKPPGKKGVPTAEAGTAEVKGSLDKELIRRIIRRHMNEVKSCYEKELARSPSIQGRVMVQFVISPTGMVKEATTESSTLGNPVVEDCVVAAIKSWEFPKPNPRGDVYVSYPFLFRSE